MLYARGANITGDKAVLDYLNFLNFDAPEVVDDPRPAQVLIDEAVKAANNADVIVAAVGESRGMSHESSSRTDLNIPQSQRDLIKALKATGKPLVLVLMNGRPLSILEENQQADAILKPGSQVPKVATPLPTCCSATTTHRASCRSPSLAPLGRFQPITTT